MSERTYYSQEAEARARRKTMITAGGVMALGLGLGAALAMLYAPKKGKELREELAGDLNKGFKLGRKKAKQAMLMAKDQAGDFEKMASKQAKAGRETAVDLLDRLEAEVSDLRKSLTKQFG